MQHCLRCLAELSGDLLILSEPGDLQSQELLVKHREISTFVPLKIFQ